MLSKFASLKIGAKIISLILFVILIGSGVSIYIASSLKTIDTAYSNLIDEQAKAVSTVKVLDGQTSDIAYFLYRMIAESDQASMQATKGDLDQAFKAANNSLDDLKTLAPDHAADIEALRQKLNGTMKDAADRVSTATLANDNQKSMSLAASEFGPAYNATQKQTDVLVTAMQAALDAGNTATTALTNSTIMIAYIAIAVGALISIGLALFLTNRQLVRPVVSLTTAMEAVARGEDNVTVPGAERKDEIGAMSRAFENNAKRVADLAMRQREQEAIALRQRKDDMLKMADDFERSVGGIVTLVSSAATEMQAAAAQLTSTAQEASAQSVAVSAAAEEAGTNVTSVAGSAEELGASVSEIGRQVETSAQISASAVNEARQAMQVVSELNDVASSITGVVDMISGLASQTNLLALNATIESARAGEAGKGFAVVASEVKALAGQTAKATTEISAKIEQIQEATVRAVGVIQGITGTIQEINSASTAIASAVEQQNAATQEIVQAVNQASVGTSEVTANITGVAQAAEQTGAAASQVLSSSGELAEQAEKLRYEMDTFLATVRAA
ncbi:methyl-accepting chemotaxis protein [Asticcacaulis sp. 201]|uniref:methyl-accepting chemotaxis protein n=1 Tax=Asticcacaulis sp. 201 TaxID=3028787 RepID=UPI002916E9D1|nr:methyl-accepting chemotaxis protein [Asticcacaulis sp. 201]MDV6331202.1 methyl-accepting chemotaxis protein [Asticcacaulis sp. 201]